MDSLVSSTELILFCSPEMETLAKGIIAAHRDKIHLHILDWKRFKDGFPDLFIQDVRYIRDKDVAFLCSLSKPEIIFEQIAVLYGLPRYLIKSLKIVLPFFPTATMERVDHEGQIATAMTLARLLSSVPITFTGPTRMLCWDIHALSIRFYFGDNLIPVFESAIPLLKKKLLTLEDHDRVSIVFPDEGAFKRFHWFFDEDYPLVICHKVRNGDKRVVHVKEGEAEGRHCVIIDDLVQSGGTLLECGKALLAKGAKSLSCFVTHAVFPQESEMRFLQGVGDGYFDASLDVPFANFWITDSCPNPLVVKLQRGKKHPPFELISLAEEIGNKLLGVDAD